MFDTSVAGTKLAGWVFDTLAKGQPTSSSSFVGGLEYKKSVKGYDNGYRPTGATVSIPAGAPAFAGTSFTKDLFYYADGSLAAESTPAFAGLPAEVVYTSYNAQGLQNGLAGATSYMAVGTYSAAGELVQVERSGATSSAITFGLDQATGALTRIQETKRTGSVFTLVADRQYTRAKSGLITRAITSAEGQSNDTQCFRYDGLQQLTGAWTPSSGNCDAAPGALGGPAQYRVEYAVNPSDGNRTAQTKFPAGGGDPTVTTYTYPAPGQPRPHSVTSTSTVTGGGTPTTAAFSYDAAGNTITRPGQTLSYDTAGRMTGVTTGSGSQTSVFDADGELLVRVDGSDKRLFLGDIEAKQTAAGTTAVRTYSVNGMPIAERTSQTAGVTRLVWLSPDLVNTVGLQIDVATGTVTRRWTDPYGNPRGGSAPWASSHGYLNAPESPLTGLTRLGAREYDAGLGKFLTVDPVLDTGNPVQFNAYAYSGNSPITYSDPTGLLAATAYLPDGGGGRRSGSTQTSNSNPPSAPGKKTTPERTSTGSCTDNDSCQTGRQTVTSDVRGCGTADWGCRIKAEISYWEQTRSCSGTGRFAVCRDSRTYSPGALTYDYKYEYAIAPAAAFTAEEIMQEFQANPSDVFPFKVSGCGSFSTGTECTLHTDIAMTSGYVSVPAKPTGLVGVDTTDTSVKFTVLKPGYFDAPGSTIEFSTIEKGGTVYLRQEAHAHGVPWTVKAGIDWEIFGGARATWQLQADNLRGALTK